MHKDVHQQGSAYCIRSLYFDDPQGSCMDENHAGVDLRKKYRIRIYDAAQQSMHLEIKEKVHGFTKKSACDVSRDECRRLMDSSCPSLPFDSRTVFNALKLEMKMRQFQPKAIIDYERSAFVSHAGNVRITFDRNITVSTHIDEFLEDRLSSPVFLLPSGMHILEVKYDELIPDHYLQLIQSINPQRIAFSKYYLGRLAAQGDFLY